MKLAKISLKIEEVKRIRCKGRFKGSYVDPSKGRLLGGRCDSIYGFTDGETFIQSPNAKPIKEEIVSDSEFELRSEDVLIEGIDEIQFEYDGTQVPLYFNRWKQNGKSTIYRCKDCGKEKKIVGMKYYFDYRDEMSQNLFDIINHIQ